MALRRTETQPMTYDDYCLLPDDGKRYQVIEGELFVSPAPRTTHQQIIVQLMALLHTHVTAHRLGKVYVAPTDVLLSPTTVVQPDILFIRRENLGIITELNIQGPPDLCIEVLSPGTESVDRERKMAVYARYGVQEYWIINPMRQMVSIYACDSGIFALKREMTGNDMVISDVVSGFQTNTRSIFASEE
ncbi:MAG: Uma2 family endonuclease [Chloroflexota bacterium]|nr:Uma2 family endonuclease [Chloroflexota bacterium]